MSAPINASPAALQRMLCVSAATEGPGTLSLQDGMIFDLAEWVQGDEAKVAVFTCEEPEPPLDGPLASSLTVPSPHRGEHLGHEPVQDEPLPKTEATLAFVRSSLLSASHENTDAQCKSLKGSDALRPIRKMGSLEQEALKTAPAGVGPEGPKTEVPILLCPSQGALLLPEVPPAGSPASTRLEASCVGDSVRIESFEGPSQQASESLASQGFGLWGKSSLGDSHLEIGRLGGALSPVSLADPLVGQARVAKMPLPTEGALQGRQAPLASYGLSALNPVDLQRQTVQGPAAQEPSVPSVLSKPDHPISNLSPLSLTTDRTGPVAAALELAPLKEGLEEHVGQAVLEDFLPARYPELVSPVSAQRAGLLYRMPAALPVHSMAPRAGFPIERITMPAAWAGADKDLAFEENPSSLEPTAAPFVTHSHAPESVKPGRSGVAATASVHDELYDTAQPQAPVADAMSVATGAQEALDDGPQATGPWHFQSDRVAQALVPYIVQYVGQLQDYAGQWRRMPVRLEGKAAGALIFRVEGKTLSLSLRDADAGICSEIMNHHKDLVAYASELGLALRIEQSGAMPLETPQTRLAYLA